MSGSSTPSTPGTAPPHDRTLQIRPGEVAAVCQKDAIQQMPDGLGRICAVWIRLDQAGLVGSAR
jgi:hypothetical protein